MDPANPALAGKPPVRKLVGGRPEEAGGVPRVPPQAQAATS
jgi:hypothetical protein